MKSQRRLTMTETRLSLTVTVPTDGEIKAAVQSIANLRQWIREVYEDTEKYEDIAFQALNSTTETAGWSNFLVNTVINIATGIIDTALVVSGAPAVVPAMGFLSAEIKEWINGPNRPSNFPDVFTEYELSHLAMLEAMEKQLSHYLDQTNNYANLRAAWDKTFQVQGTTYKLSDLAKPEHAFPPLGDLWNCIKATATTEFQKRLWNLIVMKTCSYYANEFYYFLYTTTATTDPAAENELAEYVRQGLYTTNPGVYATRNYLGNDQETGGLQFEVAYSNLGLGGNEFPPAVCDMLFRDDTLGHIIRPDALFPRDYVFKQFSFKKQYLGQNSNWKEIPDGDIDWVFTGGYFPELTTS
jgi:hypothetical protein